MVLPQENLLQSHTLLHHRQKTPKAQLLLSILAHIPTAKLIDEFQLDFVTLGSERKHASIDLSVSIIDDFFFTKNADGCDLCERDNFLFWDIVIYSVEIGIGQYFDVSCNLFATDPQAILIEIIGILIEDGDGFGDLDFSSDEQVETAGLLALTVDHLPLLELTHR